MKKNWKILQPDADTVRKICNALNCSPVTAAILVNRNIVSEADARHFLNASLNDLRPPFSMKDMDIAVRRIYTAIQHNEKILIFGDYDADGITATTILFEFLQYTGANVSYYIPHRVKEGYSLQTFHISKHAIPNKIRLIITADCGSKSHDAVTLAKQHGIDVVITDHHDIEGHPPESLALVNPKRQDCTSGFEHLAGVGVVFFLMICLRKHLRDINFWKDRPEPNLKNFCDLVALGTIADVVPLVKENRIFSKIGIEMIRSAALRPGIRALIKASGISSTAIDTDDIAFRLGPRLNAAGRMAHAKTAVELLSEKDAEAAGEIARSLNQMNQDRQHIEKEIFGEIVAYIKNHSDILRKQTLVLSNPGWHEGVIGIVASRVVEKYFRPAILISTRNGMGKGSGRSIPGVDIHKGLLACADDLEFFGGHAMAAGLTMKSENIPRFQEHFENAVLNMGQNAFTPTLTIDHELNFEDISDDLIDELESLAPFGEGNPEPLFTAVNVRVSASKILGENHRRMTLRQQVDGRTSRAITAIQFNIGADALLRNHFERMVFRLRWNRWNGRKTAQIVVEDL
ncbi:MAG: single-stranded-DNA-specific exonuclease RecJ [Desulfobacteraceae bacterium IS3]|nr:MAG: single-stranded-DNA-specific exonuclease RecJ [Desulfobacteraceae bacterium IS3]